MKPTANTKTSVTIGPTEVVVDEDVEMLVVTLERLIVVVEVKVEVVSELLVLSDVLVAMLLEVVGLVELVEDD